MKATKMTPQGVILSINRKGSFEVSPEQFTSAQCGVNGIQKYNYHVTISASDKKLIEPQGFVIDNMDVKSYFEETFEKGKEKCASCEVISCNAVSHFRDVFDKKYPFIDLESIKVVVSGSDMSFIEGYWKNPAYGK